MCRIPKEIVDSWKQANPWASGVMNTDASNSVHDIPYEVTPPIDCLDTYMTPLESDGLDVYSPVDVTLDNILDFPGANVNTQKSVGVDVDSRSYVDKNNMDSCMDTNDLISTMDENIQDSVYIKNQNNMYLARALSQAKRMG